MLVVRYLQELWLWGFRGGGTLGIPLVRAPAPAGQFLKYSCKRKESIKQSHTKETNGKMSMK